jgi:hypothetical protein
MAGWLERGRHGKGEDGAGVMVHMAGRGEEDKDP